MIDLVLDQASKCGLASKIEARVGDVFAEGGALSDLRSFDALILGFGVLNYAVELDTTLEVLVEHLKPEGVILASVLTRRPIWDLLWHWTVLRRHSARWSRKPTEFSLGGASCLERHWVLADFTRALPAGYRVVHWEAMGHISPPPYLDAALARVPGMKRRALRLDLATRRSWAARWGGDLLWVVIQASTPRPAAYSSITTTAYGGLRMGWTTRSGAFCDQPD